MNNVDQIIKYLSGDMNLEEAGSFEKDLASNLELKEEYNDVSEAYRLIKDQLQKRDLNSFKGKLLEVMEQTSPKIRYNVFRHKPGWYIMLPLAASLAILLALFLKDEGPERILSRFFNPQKDPVVLAYNQGTRGDTASGVLLYQVGQYQESMVELSHRLDQDPNNQVALLFYLLASMELDLQEEVVKRIQTLPYNTESPLGQSLIWYTSLALIKSDRMKEAEIQLRPLIMQAGPYQTDASRMQKMLLK